MSRSLWREGELYAALGVLREALRGYGSASGVIGCRGGLSEGCGDPCVKAGDRGDDEALCLLCLRLLEGSVFWAPLD